MPRLCRDWIGTYCRIRALQKNQMMCSTDIMDVKNACLQVRLYIRQLTYTDRIFRLFGFIVAPEIFQETINRILGGLPGVEA